MCVRPKNSIRLCNLQSAPFVCELNPEASQPGPRGGFGSGSHTLRQRLLVKTWRKRTRFLCARRGANGSRRPSRLGKWTECLREERAPAPGIQEICWHSTGRGRKGGRAAVRFGVLIGPLETLDPRPSPPNPLICMRRPQPQPPRLQTRPALVLIPRTLCAGPRLPRMEFCSQIVK